MKNLEVPKRFENAVTKLYQAFHNGELQAADCEMCAVGSICDGHIHWAAYTDFGDPKSKIGVVTKTENEDHLRLGKKVIDDTGYSIMEILTIEKVFLFAMNFKSYDEITENQAKSLQFKGLCAVIEYLCKLDGLENVMDFTSLFETENNKPKHELTF